ncbi:MarR family winged helix-turn-helix transcriptional regulator [Bacillus suaedae]|uniref:MarR family transcriptional regulator n=1 Tax=Halalkalibacter suaedae TaxID=2822140 RepID=A0A940WQB2_9BACI|nr:winged helix DNA-binding protein [Bacillus suaedae]MBP3950386.1 MarR family transcriptional regulator [Bacillus suaedae]
MENIREVFQVFGRRFGILNKNCCGVGEAVTPVQSHIIYEIAKLKEGSMQEVAEVLNSDITTFSRQIQTLVKMGLVSKHASVKDKRMYLLSLTKKGMEVHTGIGEEMERNLENLFKNMTLFEQETVIRSLQLLNKHMGESTSCCKTII